MTRENYFIMIVCSSITLWFIGIIYWFALNEWYLHLKGKGEGREEPQSQAKAVAWVTAWWVIFGSFYWYYHD